MGLSVALSNALSGMNVGQRALDVLSRNVANAGTPGYHRQSLTVLDKMGSSAYVQPGTLTRAFSASLQAHYTRGVADASYADTVASVLDRLQTAFGKPGDPGSLDTAFGEFQNALSSLATSPDNFATRGEVIASAQGIASTLNRLSGDIQSLRSDADTEIANSVANLNRALGSLEAVNLRLSDEGADSGSRAALMDQRDRLIAEVAGEIDINVDYRANGSVALMTRGGIGILDAKAAIFSYDGGGGHLSASSLYSADPDESGVGVLSITSTAGLKVDLVADNVLQSGRLSALVELRDDTLVRAQGQLDDIAAALAQSLSTVETAGTAATSGAGAAGFEIDIAGIRPGNDFVLDYTVNGNPRQLRVIRVEDPSQLPMDFTDANGARVVGMSFASGAAAVAAALNGIVGPGLTASNPAGSTLRVLDDGAAGTTDVSGLISRTTVTGTQNGLALSLFVDSGNADFTDAINDVPQRRGFASRIAVNSAVRIDNRLLVQYASGGALGDASRAEYLRDRLDDARFVSLVSTDAIDGNFRLSGTTGDMIAQTLNYQGNAAAAAQSTKENRDLSMEALTQRMNDAYGVDVDDEMARLMELQNAFAANARIVSAVQDLINALLDI